MLDDFVRAELQRQADGYVKRENAAEEVPARVQALRKNIARLEGRDGRPEETREQNEFELEFLLKLAPVWNVPTEVADEQSQAEETE